MIEVLPLKKEDMIWVIENGAKEVGLKSIPTKEIEKLAQEREDSGLCVTGWVDGHIIGVSGIELLWEGVGEVWLILSSYIDHNPKECFRCIKDGLEILIKRAGLRRTQGYGRIGFHQAHILYKHLGFKAEGIMKEFTPDGVDCIMYARLERRPNGHER